MMLKKFFSACLALAFGLALFTGCGNSTSSVAADLSYTQASIGILPISSDVQVVGLGEASHGVAQYHQMKADVFQSLVNNNGCRTFIIEGDFGGALKVDHYINGGGGSAKEAVGEIGFAIYQTQEMVDLIEWMRSYNETASPEKTLHFYGMDVQRFDNNKEYLFSVLDQAAPELSAEYTEAFAHLTDENRNSLDMAVLDSAKAAASELINKMDAVEIADASGKTAFALARECANTILAYCNLQLSDDYNGTRDQYMYEKIEWFLQHGDGSILFINGHNGHIGKTSIAGYTCLGELLSENLENGYYAIGTDAQETQFNSQKDDGAFEVVGVSNSNDLNSLLVGAGSDWYFIDCASAQSDETWKQILSSEQIITTLNVGLSGMMKMVKSAYTTAIIPQSTFDGMIVFRTVTPSTMIEPLS